MCAPHIVGGVHDGDPAAARPSRRAVLGAAGLGALAAFTAGPARAQRAGTVVDLTHPLSPATPVWPGNPPFTMVPVAVRAVGGFEQKAIGLWEHTGTHIDAPIHRAAGGASVDAIAAQDLVAPLVVIDIGARAAADVDAVLTVADIETFEARHGRIPERAFVALHSGWERRLATPGAFVNLDGAGTPHAPGFAPEAAEYLVAQRDIVGAGVDTLSLDHASSHDYGAHTAFLGAGRYGVEMLANLAAVPPTGATVVIGAPKHTGGTGGPCRVLALL
ncbi:cyclase family protein [Nocardia terpenica]|uniref:cyclase family protein n=1 Tax=Nocardia terpenica TaxID=455432 RepID=UPI0018953A8D|nr:cyclase family protein [Nocardia terpenica]MBF6059174.1 cyclase family protein [Nocardia terpenica]MBF6103287.1 cyclase family protein [Nocardia terpenica]MBF6110524.1 cyclase family protein [Nocardia terpenica]MBF6116655.1 cyclase family protein [Nocardia terpenica]